MVDKVQQWEERPETFYDQYGDRGTPRVLKTRWVSVSEVRTYLLWTQEPGTT